MNPQLFNFQNTSIRVIQDEQGNVWFYGKEVCDVLGFKHHRSAIRNHCRVKGVLKQHSLTSGGNQAVQLINEGNLYRLVSRSPHSEAIIFEEWVFDEVLPSIRKTGGYYIESTLQNRVAVLEAKVATLEKQLAYSPVRSAHRLLSKGNEAELVKQHFGPPKNDGTDQFLSNSQIVAMLRFREPKQGFGSKRIAQAVSQLSGAKSSFVTKQNGRCQRGYYLQVLTNV